MKKKIYRKPKKGMLFTAIVVLILCALVSYKKIDLNMERTAAAKEYSQYEKQKQALIEEQEEIEEYKAYVQTKKYIEQIARDKLGLVYEDEIIFESEK